MLSGSTQTQSQALDKPLLRKLAKELRKKIKYPYRYTHEEIEKLFSNLSTEEGRYIIEDRSDNDGETALLLAASNSAEKTIKLLIKYNIDLEVLDQKKQTALERSLDSKNFSAFYILLTYSKNFKSCQNAFYKFANNYKLHHYNYLNYANYFIPDDILNSEKKSYDLYQLIEKLWNNKCENLIKEWIAANNKNLLVEFATNEAKNRLNLISFTNFKRLMKLLDKYDVAISLKIKCYQLVPTNNCPGSDLWLFYRQAQTIIAQLKQQAALEEQKSDCFIEEPGGETMALSLEQETEIFKHYLKGNSQREADDFFHQLSGGLPGEKPLEVTDDWKPYIINFAKFQKNTNQKIEELQDENRTLKLQLAHLENKFAALESRLFSNEEQKFERSNSPTGRFFGN